MLTKVATVAAEVASDKLYVLDDETGRAEKSILRMLKLNLQSHGQIK